MHSERYGGDNIEREDSMAQTNDGYIIRLEKAHLEWGIHRYTDSRGRIYGEGYIPIPAKKAYSYNLLNSNGTGGKDVWGTNLFQCTSVDGYFSGVLRAQGNQADTRYAKQFAGDKDLKALGRWFAQVHADEGDEVCVIWEDEINIVIELIKP